MRQVDLEFVRGLYAKYREPLAEVREAQRRFCRDRSRAVTPQLDDLEAEITYLLLREHRPPTVMELGTFHGWSTTWLLSALRDNGAGHLHSFDIVDNAMTTVPETLAGDRWTFHHGDIRRNLDAVPEKVTYLFVDAAHHGRFARWYIANLVPLMPPGIPVSVHDVFHGKRPMPFTEGAAVLKWLAAENLPLFTPSRARAPEVYAALHEVKRDLGLAEPIHAGSDNPMIFFRLPESRSPRAGAARG